MKLFTLKISYNFECLCGKGKKGFLPNENFINIFRTDKESDNFTDLVENLLLDEQIVISCECSTKQEHLQTKKNIRYDFKDTSFLIIRINNFRAHFSDQIVDKKKFLRLENLPINITNFQSDQIKIFNNYFQLMAVVDHYGTMKSGHYTCKIRMEKDDWFIISDNQRKACKDPASENLKNAYYIVLKKLH